MIRTKYFFYIGVLLLIISSCSGTKHLPADEYLYVGTRGMKLKKKEMPDTTFHIKDRTAKNVEVWKTAWVGPNGALLGTPFLRFFPMRLYLYNAFYTDSETGFKHWMMMNFGEPPRTITGLSPDIRTERIKRDLKAMGHFDVEGYYKIYKRERKKKARVGYYFFVGPEYHLKSFDYFEIPEYPKLDSIVTTHFEETEIEIGMPFRLALLEEDKNQLANKLKNNGYYWLNDENIRLLADTTGLKRKVRIKYQVREELGSSVYKPCSIYDVELRIDGTTRLDTAAHHYTLLDSTNHISKALLDRAIRLKKGDIYHYNNSRRTANNLASTAIFKEVSLAYQPLETDSNQLKAIVDVRTADRFELSLEGAATTKSSHFAGPYLGANFTHRNLFGRGESFTNGVSFFYDFPTGVLAERSSPSSGFTFTSSISYPKIRSSFGIARQSIYGLPKGVIGASFEYNNRSDYFKIVNWKLNYGISWKPRKYVEHHIDWANLTYSNLLSTTVRFDSIVDSNEQIKLSFEEQFIVGPGYVFTYNNTPEKNRRHAIFFQGRAGFSGAAINGLQSIFDSKHKGERTLLSISYAQFVQLEAEGRYFWRFSGENLLGFRLRSGLGYAYGNSDVMPYIKQYFVGGGASLRPIGARVFGPGTYLSIFEDDDVNNTIEQNGDVVIEGNVEFRFNIIYKLKGAVWSDFGNIYLRKDDPERPGGEFEWDSFMQKMIVTSGLGLRLDLDFLVLRWDVGFITYYPWMDKGNRWFNQNDANLFGGYIGIGYPF